MKLHVTVTEELRPTKKGNGRMQVVGLHTGGSFPIEDTIYIPNEDKPLVPGQYIAEGRLVREGYKIVFVYSARDLKPAK